MKYLKIAALFSLVNAIFFGAFLAVLNRQNLKLQPPESTQNGAVQSAPAVQLPTGTPVVTSQEKPVRPARQPVQPPVQQPAPVVAASPLPQAPAANRCIITIQGRRYDVADFRNRHSGGDIFVCNTDMTQVFFSQHDQQLLDSARMAALRVQ